MHSNKNLTYWLLVQIGHPFHKIGNGFIQIKIKSPPSALKKTWVMYHHSKQTIVAPIFSKIAYDWSNKWYPLVFNQSGHMFLTSTLMSDVLTVWGGRHGYWQPGCVLRYHMIGPISDTHIISNQSWDMLLTSTLMSDVLTVWGGRHGYWQPGCVLIWTALRRHHREPGTSCASHR